MVGQRGARHHAAAETSTRGAAGLVEILGLLGVEQLNGDDATFATGGGVPQLQREAGPVFAGVAGEIHPVLDRPGIQRQCIDVKVLPRGEVAVTRCLRQPSRTAFDKTQVGQVDFAIDQPRRRAVGVQVIDVGVHGEVIGLLDHTEGEAIPLQGARSRRLHQGADRILVEESQRGRHELDARGIGDGPTGDRLCGHLKGAVVSVVATNVGVDRVGHRRDVAPAVDVPGGHDQPRDFPAVRLGVISRPQVLRLPKAGRHWVDLGLGHDLATGRRGRPRGHRAASWTPGTVGSDDDHVELLTLR